MGVPSPWKQYGCTCKGWRNVSSNLTVAHSTSFKLHRAQLAVYRSQHFWPKSGFLASAASVLTPLLKPFSWVSHLWPKSLENCFNTLAYSMSWTATKFGLFRVWFNKDGSMMAVYQILPPILQLGSSPPGQHFAWSLHLSLKQVLLKK